jgi:butyryl-CoA:acetate CoA-transferase
MMANDALLKQYAAKCVTADEAVACVKSGDWIEFGFFANLPLTLDAALAKRMAALKDIKLRGGVLMQMLETLESEAATWYSYHFGGLERVLAKEGKAYHIPIKYSEVPVYLRENLTTDVVMVQAAPMDENGYFNFGVTFSHFKAAIEKAKTVIIEVNTNLPRVYGGYDHAVHIDDVHYIVEGENNAIFELPSAVPSETDLKIASYVMPEIEDGACLQLGIGGLPNALGKLIAKSDLKDLSVHSEMLADAFVDLAEAGKITGKYKELDNGKIVFTFAAGSQKLYAFMHDNPMLAAYPVDYVNNVLVTSKIKHFISINGALEIDLTGQVCSESMGYKQFTGAGGQLDFVEGAYLSEGGKTFICLPATFKDKTGALHSRINPVLTSGAVVTTPRNAVQYVVTEYGCVNLKGLSTKERAEKIISIAHPDFRDSLKKAAGTMGL